MDTRTVAVQLNYETASATFTTDSVLDLAIIHTQAEKAIRLLTGMDAAAFYAQARELFAPVANEGSNA